MAESPSHDQTEYWPAGKALPGMSAGKVPIEIGRYSIDCLLGNGGFGCVYLAYDDQLTREVAIKVPHSDKLKGPLDVAAYLSEAQATASIEHPNIVPVHDVGSTDRFPVFIVSRYIKGQTLSERLRNETVSLTETVELVATMAEALHEAHKQGLVHRDVKPGNVMIDTAGKPYLVDFGLVLRDEDVREESGIVGTPAYMSPEQARGEGHRVDGRSDIFSLGVVLYEMIVGHRPFRASTRAALLDRIVRGHVRPPRQSNDLIPRQLERICLKALATRPSDRYSTAGDFAGDLHECLQEILGAEHPQTVASTTVMAPHGGTNSGAGNSEATSTVHPSLLMTGQGQSTHSQTGDWVPVVPKGLRSFDEYDEDFFLNLLPGPRDRNGLPESVLFWTRRLAETDPDRTFPVGLLYGPSGCGKSSLVKAGILPKLPDHVHSIYIEATATETEIRILRQIHKRFPDLPAADRLCDQLTAIRRGDGIPDGEKVVLIFDQFEQWLHAQEGDDSDLSDALRQCDGSRVQCVLLIRDDFWLSVSRLMARIDIELAQNQNMALVDLFDKLHARKVLTEYGIAFKRLPVQQGQVTADQEAFLDAAVDGLAQYEKISPVRLALFAEMVKGREWTPATLRQLGGIQGVGTRFLEEAFDRPTTDASLLPHHRAILQTLTALLPGAGTDIKGTMKSYEELRSAAGYQNDAAAFRQVLDILDYDLRLITPTDPEGRSFDEETSSVLESDSFAGVRYFQLTHDFLVPSIRDWVDRHQRATLRGRISHRLHEQAELWSLHPDKRFLPSWWEWAGFWTLTNRRLWSESEKRMMSAANRRSLLLTFAVIGLLAGGVWAATTFRAAARSRALVDQLATAQPAEVPALLEQLQQKPDLARRQLVELQDRAIPGSNAELFASLALVETDPSALELLADRLLDVSLDTQQILLQSLTSHNAELQKPLWATLEDSTIEALPRFRAATALASIDPPGDASMRERWQPHAEFIVEQMIATANSERQSYAVLVELMSPAVNAIHAPLRDVFRDRSTTGDRRQVATSLLLDLLHDDPTMLTDTFLDGSDEQLRLALPIIEQHAQQIIPVLEQTIASSREPSAVNTLEQLNSSAWNSLVADQVCYGRRQSTAQGLLIRFARRDEFWATLRHSSRPDPRTYLIHRLSLLGVDANIVVDRLLSESDADMQAVLLQALGEYTPSEIDTTRRELVVGKAQQWFRDALDAELHASAEFLLNRWDYGDWLRRVSPTLTQIENENAQWRRLDEGFNMVRLGDKTFRTPAPFEIADKEVTIEQYLRYNPDEVSRNDSAPTEQCPINVVSWYQAVRYCRWLTEQAGMTEDDQCYPPQHAANGDLKPYPDFAKRRGYRLPTVKEWTYACFAEAETACFFGDSDEYIDSYCWCRSNSGQVSHQLGTLKPNHFGLFGMHANVSEWCNDVRSDDRPIRGASYGHSAHRIATASREGTTAPGLRYYSYGFRIARSIIAAPPDKAD